MKHSLFLLLLLVLFPAMLQAQTDNASLQAQSPDGHTVKLVWFIKNVPADFAGFDIKRKDGLGDWQKMNVTPLLPGISQKKDLSPFESDNAEATRIKGKLKDLLKAGKLHEYDFNSFSDKWVANDKEIQDVLHLATLDFDISVISGFGFVDHTITQKMDYQYGLFLHGSDKLVVKISWNYGEVPDLNVVREITSKSQPGKKGVQLIWNADAARVRSSYVAGFNVYKRGIRLNDRPVYFSGGKDNTEYTFNDAGANSSVSDQYSISAESLFGIEGTIKSYVYNPEEHPAEYKKATVTQISSLGFYFKDGIELSWTFSREQERFIKGFYVEKDNMPEGYQRVSDLLPADTRSYVDKSTSPVSSAIRMKVIAVYNDRTAAQGVERLYSYFPLIDPPRPQNTKAVLTTENKKVSVRLSWDPIMNGDSATRYYSVYVLSGTGAKVDMLAEKIPGKQNSFTHTFSSGTGGIYRFYLMAEGRSGGLSIPGDTVTVSVPVTELPEVVITAASEQGGNAMIQWQYNDMQDLVGFRLYDDATVIADENVLGKNVREYIAKALQPGSVHNYTVRAVSAKGVLSEKAVSMQVTIPAAAKK